MAALDDVDGVDLHVAEMVRGGGNRLRPTTKRFLRLKPLGLQPDSPGLGFGQGKGCSRAGHRVAM
jgi:hypothetical protein